MVSFNQKTLLITKSFIKKGKNFVIIFQKN